MSENSQHFKTTNGHEILSSFIAFNLPMVRMMTAVIIDMKEGHLYILTICCVPEAVPLSRYKHSEVHEWFRLHVPILLAWVTAFLSESSVFILPNMKHLIFIEYMLPGEICNSLCMRCSLFTLNIREFNLYLFLKYCLFPSPDPRTYSTGVHLQLCRSQSHSWTECM